MLIKTLEVGYLQTNCYIVTDENTLECAVIDPGADAGHIATYLEDNKLKPRAILLTHGHFDHCMGVNDLAEELDLPVYMNEKDLGREIGNNYWTFDPPEDTRFVKEGDEIQVGGLTFRVIECPGHTPGGLTYQVENCLFTGDTLFRLSCGRYDFPASSSVELTLSLTKLRDLEGDYEVYPGHEAPTTLEFERRFNPYVMQPWNL